MKFIKNIRNELDFNLRKNLKFSREYKGDNEPNENIFSDFQPEEAEKAIQKENFLYQHYKLQSLKDNSSKRIYLENLATIELLEQCLNIEPKDQKILDIGAKNWFYVFGLYQFFKHANTEKHIYLDGIEVDAYRMYSNLYTRRDYALYYSKNLTNANYIVADFLKHKEKYDYITWFFPFVTEFPLLQWGLPLSKFRPLEMLAHAVECLNSNGQILIVNQDKNEYQIQNNMIKKLGLNHKKIGIIKNSFIEYEHSRYVTVIQAT